jgi:hypothetical protein
MFRGAALGVGEENLTFVLVRRGRAKNPAFLTFHLLAAD